MGHIFIAVSPCQLPPKERRQIEHDCPGLRIPDEGRLASRLDIEAALAAHPEWQVEFEQGDGWWSAFVRSQDRIASLRVRDYSGDPAFAQRFSFDTGDADLVVDIVAAVAERCGPFLVMDESGGYMVLVNPDGSRSDVGEWPAGGSRPPSRP
jgi:hypothetical protein